MRPFAPVVLTLSLLLPALARPDDAPKDLGALLEQADLAYGRRDEPDALDLLKTSLEEAQKLAPDDYEVLWRQARLDFWISDDPGLSAKEKSRVGKLAWDLGDRATRASPDRVEGWHYAAAGMGTYALGIGVLQALGEGIEAKFKERLGKAEKIDPGFEHGAVQTAWGRFYFKLPWPKYDAKRSEKALEAALAMNPDNVRAHVYLAQLLARERHGDRAHEELDHALAKPPGQYDAPEERRWQEVARTELARKPAR
jgi:hypothetical protein